MQESIQKVVAFSTIFFILYVGGQIWSISGFMYTIIRKMGWYRAPQGEVAHTPRLRLILTCVARVIYLHGCTWAKVVSW